VWSSPLILIVKAIGIPHWSYEVVRIVETVASLSAGDWLGDISTGSMITHRLNRLNRLRSAWHPILSAASSLPNRKRVALSAVGTLADMLRNGGRGSCFYSQGVQLHQPCVTHGQTALRASPEMVPLNELRLRCLTAISGCDGHLLELR